MKTNKYVSFCEFLVAKAYDETVQSFSSLPSLSMTTQRENSVGDETSLPYLSMTTQRES